MPTVTPSWYPYKYLHHVMHLSINDIEKISKLTDRIRSLQYLKRQLSGVGNSEEQIKPIQDLVKEIETEIIIRWNGGREEAVNNLLTAFEEYKEQWGKAR